MPPLSGFVGKILILQAAEGMGEIAWVWPAILLSGLACLVAISRAGTTIFWRSTGTVSIDAAISPLKLVAVSLLLCASPLLVVFGEPVIGYTDLAAAELHGRIGSINTVLEGEGK
jgi:multicomponent K+:H+ antiporter subunit D